MTVGTAKPVNSAKRARPTFESEEIEKAAKALDDGHKEQAAPLAKRKKRKDATKIEDDIDAIFNGL